MKCRIASIVKETSTDGTGLRNSVYFQGCSIHCPGCHNKNTWSFNGGEDYEVTALVEELSTKFTDGISILGGEPTDQPEALAELIKCYKESNPGKTVWVYTGRTIEYLKSHKPLAYKTIMSYADKVVDGPYQSYNGPHIKFRGSPNQHIYSIQDGRYFKED